MVAVEGMTVIDVTRLRLTRCWAASLNKTARAQEAEPLLREAVAIRRKPLSRPGLAAPLGALGECLATEKRYAEAEPLLVESYQIYKSLHVPESPLRREVHEPFGFALGKNRPRWR